jgi:hypothetical protein
VRKKKGNTFGCCLLCLSAELYHQLQVLPQLEQAEAGPKSMLELILNPYPKKSTVTGLAFSSKSLSMIN